MTSQEEVDTILGEFNIADMEDFKTFIMESKDIGNDLTNLKPAELSKVNIC